MLRKTQPNSAYDNLGHANSTTSEVGIVVHAIGNSDASWWVAVTSEELNTKFKVFKIDHFR